MKLSTTFDFIIPCLILTSLCLFVIPADSASQLFTYNENLSNTKFPNVTLRITDLKTYDDGTILLRIIRRNATASRPGNTCVEQILSLRIINLNGTVTDTNIDNTVLGLDPINYCIFVDDFGLTKNPISIFPLQNQFILVNYVNMTNPSDNTTYEDWGMVVDWSGSVVYSKLRYGKSNVNQNGHWDPNYSISPNINRAMGFLRLTTINSSTAQWQQCSVDGSGNLSMLSSDYIISPGFSSFTFSAFSTVNQGYAIVYANTSTPTTNSTDIFQTVGAVYAIFLSYGQQSTSTPYILYQTPLPNLNFGAIFCDIAFVGVGQVCTVSLTQNGTNPYYLKIFFLSSGSVVSFTSLQNQIPTVNVSNTGWNVVEMPFGGYILNAQAPFANGSLGYYIAAYGEDDKQISTDLTSPMITNIFGVTGIMKNNNTFVLGQPESTDSWSLLTNQLPKVVGTSDHGYGNFQVNITNPNINAVVLQSANNISITFYEAVDLSEGNITIYQNINSTSDNLRQTTSGLNPFCQLSADGLTVTVTLITSTFNQPGKQYFVQMDNNFVKSRRFHEPLTGIDSRVWMVTTDNFQVPSSAAVTGILRLTPAASIIFEENYKSQRDHYFNTLLQEIANKVPVRLSRLSTNERYQVINAGTSSEQVLISINIAMPQDKSDVGIPRIISDLNVMIANKQITTISSGVTNDLDPTYGFQPSQDLWERYRIKLIGVFLVITLFVILFLVAQKRQRDAQNLAVLQLGLIIFTLILEILFVASNARDIQQLFLPSVLFLIIPLGVNTALAFYIISKENVRSKFYKWFSENGKVASIFTVIAAADIEALMVLQSRLAGLSFFHAPFSNDAVSLIFWGACVNIFIKNIPQVTIQVIYYTCIVTYDIIPLLLLISSCITLVVNIIGRLYQATHRYRNRNESEYTLPPTDDAPDNFGGLHPLQIPPAMLNKGNPMSPDTPSKKGFLRRSGGKRNSRNGKRMSGFIADSELENVEELRNVEGLTNIELRNFEGVEGTDDGTLYGDVGSNQYSQTILPQEQFDEGENISRNSGHSDFENSGSVSTKRSVSSFEEVSRQ